MASNKLQKKNEQVIEHFPRVHKKYVLSMGVNKVVWVRFLLIFDMKYLIIVYIICLFFFLLHTPNTNNTHAYVT